MPGRRLLEIALVLLPLLCLPNLDRPFSTPKLWLLAAIDLAIAAYWFRHRTELRAPGWPWLAWLAAIAVSAVAAPYVSLEALLLAILPVPLYTIPVAAERIGRAVLGGAAIQSAVAVLQFCGLDPLRAPGWRAENFANPRMRVYGTLGNPDFVAAFLCATLPLWAGLKTKRWVAAAVSLQVAAILATGSRASVLALPAAALLLWLRGAARRWWLAGIPVVAALLWLSPARPLGVTLEGRWYLTRVAAAHWSDIPPAGFGPGGFELRFANWQSKWLAEEANESLRRFAGAVDHAHNEYVEIAVEYGPVGLAAFLSLCAWLMAKAWRVPASPWRAGAWAGLAALFAIACVDFPFHRPAEWGLFWLLFGMLGGNPYGGQPADVETVNEAVQVVAQT